MIQTSSLPLYQISNFLLSPFTFSVMPTVLICFKTENQKLDLGKCRESLNTVSPKMHFQKAALSCKTKVHIWSHRTYDWVCLQIKTEMGASIYSVLQDNSRSSCGNLLYCQNKRFFLPPFPITTFFFTFNEFLKLYEAVFS